MSATHAHDQVVIAPPELGLDTRMAFRQEVIRELDELAEGGSLVIDLANTRRVDSAGLSALMLVQRHAANRAQHLVLRSASEEIRFLLALTLMTELFEIESDRP